MKHDVRTTLILVAVFLLAQVVGLCIVDQYVSEKIVDPETGKVINVTYSGLPIGLDRPEVEESYSFIYILVAVIIATILILIMIRFKTMKLWKLWFLLAVIVCLTVAFTGFVHQYVAIGLAIILALIKIFKPNFFIHNLTEIFIYGGLAAIFVPIMDVFAAVALLILISLYDMYAVWKSKHMVKMAKFQTESKLFAGLSIPYSLKELFKFRSTGKTKKVNVDEKKTSSKKESKKASKVIKEKGIRTAILGGGDIGFPLIFAGVVMKAYLFWQVLLIPLACAVALFLLLYYAQKEKFYPAMPFISAGCLVGYGLVLLLF